MSKVDPKVKEIVIGEVSQWWGMTQLTAETLAEELLEKPQPDDTLLQVAVNKLVGYPIVRPRTDERQTR
ncbi:MAG: hypothetical protein F6K10_13780 [Moorea sp. SIO2B7]|nr:hypothetical protein [Moorena sp. SIO2B7]